MTALTNPKNPPNPIYSSWRRHLGTIWHEVWRAALTIAFAAIAALFLTPWIQSTLTPPSCDDPKDLRLVPRSELSATATSFRVKDPNFSATYEPALAIDGDSSTAWVEGNPDTGLNKYGEGQTLTIALAHPRDVQLICVINGYTSTQESYLHNSRVRQLTVTTAVGSTDSVLPEKALEFFAGYQPVNLAKGRTTTIALTIGTARAGQDPAREADTSISEVEIWATAN